MTAIVADPAPTITDPVPTRVYLDQLHEYGYEVEISHDCAHDMYLVAASGPSAISCSAAVLRDALERLSADAQVRGLSSLTVMELIHHLGLDVSPYLADEREQVLGWVRSHTADEFAAALVAVDAQEATR
jgi:hypothetical protein